MKSKLIRTLQERGFINQVTNLPGLDDAAEKGPVTSYIGFDLTADSLHVGSLIQIMVLRWMARLGHNPIVLLGEATTRIGDPSGKTHARPMLTDAEIERNRIGIVHVIDRLVGVVKPHTRHISNAEWFSNDGPSYMDFLSHYGRHFSINQMLTFDSVKTRLARQDPLSFLEFNYMLMQAIDFLKLYERCDCTLQIGGSDQWGNIVNGVELTRRIAKQEVFGLTTPLMTNSAGEKMGKTANGAIWLDADKTSAFEFFQFWRNVEDRKAGEFLRLFTELPIDDITALEIGDINAAKRVLAREVTALVHGRATAEHAAMLAEGKVETVKSEMIPVHVISAALAMAGVTLAQILFDSKLVGSKTEAAKIASNGGVKVNGATVYDVRETLHRSAFDNDNFVLSLGKKKMILVRLEDG